ncbi:MAG: MFS transporter [Elusimicrobiales bacterium]|nr:MFS transporter [Elusimicrobiales bacterium]
MKSFPTIFWIVVIIEGFMVFGYSVSFPFLAIYLNSRNYDMTTVGFYFSIVMLISSIVNSIGGKWSDYIGRRKVMFYSLFLRGIFIGIIAFVIRFNLNPAFILVLYFLASFSSLGFHAVVVAYISDIVCEKDRVNAFSILRVSTNAGWALGPALGGFLADINYAFTFFSSSVIFLIVSFYVLFYLPELKTIKYLEKENFKFSLKFDYTISKEFGLVLLYSFLMTSVMSHLVVPLSLYAKKYLGFTQKEIGFIFTLNGIIVIVIQYFVGKIIKTKNILKFIFFSCILYGVGYLMYGYSLNYSYALFSIVVITIGEVIFSPSITAYTSYIIPSSKKGSYLGLHAMVSEFGRSFGIFLGSFFIDNVSPYFKQFPWYFVLLISVVSGIGFLKLNNTAFKIKNPSTLK